MPNWKQVLDEITLRADGGDQYAIDTVRHRYLNLLSQKTGRNVICYYSGWLQKGDLGPIDINDNDKNGLMATIHGLERTKGLDLLLHTPGGDSAATESIIDYLRKMFGTDIRAFIPQIAMSAGTMIACACKEIWMGKQSNIGPIDPQLGGIPAYGVIDEFETAKQQLQGQPWSAPLWATIIGKYHPTLLADCQHAIDMSSEVTRKALATGMFEGDPAADAKIDKIIEKLNNHSDTKNHARHIHMEEAEAAGLKVQALEQDQDLQDLVLTVHHAYMHTISNTPICKIIENHLGVAVAALVPGT